MPVWLEGGALISILTKKREFFPLGFFQDDFRVAAYCWSEQNTEFQIRLGCTSLCGTIRQVIIEAGSVGEDGEVCGGQVSSSSHHPSLWWTRGSLLPNRHTSSNRPCSFTTNEQKRRVWKKECQDFTRTFSVSETGFKFRWLLVPIWTKWRVWMPGFDLLTFISFAFADNRQLVAACESRNLSRKLNLKRRQPSSS